MNMHGANRDISKYQIAYQQSYGFEAVMVAYRRKLLLDRLNHLRPEVIVEIGCGTELLYEAWLRNGAMEGAATKCWVIVEPAEEFAELARSTRLPNLHVINGFFEDAVSQVKSICPRAPDMVVCSSLLHEVSSALPMLAAIRSLMGTDSYAHFNVPNANSLHRRLAKAMGLIEDTRAKSDRNINLLQHRVYDIRSLKTDLAVAGFKVIDEGGYLVKPFTHLQMEQIAPSLGESVIDGLFNLGQELPELASEIWVEAVLGDHA